MQFVFFKKLHPDAMIPAEPVHPGDVGYDLFVLGDHKLWPGESKDIPSGIAMEPPDGVWVRIAPRSSTHRKRGLSVREGVIDQGYRGELLSYVTNDNDEPVTIKHGDRLAQLIMHPVLVFPIIESDNLAASSRGAGGFGSTGLNGGANDGR